MSPSRSPFSLALPFPLSLDRSVSPLYGRLSLIQHTSTLHYLSHPVIASPVPPPSLFQFATKATLPDGPFSSCETISRRALDVADDLLPLDGCDRSGGRRKRERTGRRRSPSFTTLPLPHPKLPFMLSAPFSRTRVSHAYRACSGLRRMRSAAASTFSRRNEVASLQEDVEGE